MVLSRLELDDDTNFVHACNYVMGRGHMYHIHDIWQPCTPTHKVIILFNI